MSIDFTDYCERCGKPIVGRRSDARYCSYACAKGSLHDLDKEARLDAKRNRSPCRQCGGAIPVAMDVRAVFCSRKCRNNWHNSRRTTEDRARYNAQRREARKRLTANQ